MPRCLQSVWPVCAESVWPCVQSIRIVLASVIVTAFTGCTSVQPVPARDEVPLPESFIGAGDGAATAASSWEQDNTPANTPWWSHLGDPALDNLLETTLSGNFSLGAARQRLAQAEAAARIAGADRLPSVSGTGGAQTNRQNSARTENYRAGLTTGWEIDLWGRIDATADAAGLQAAATGADLHAAYVSVTAETASVYYRLLQQRAVTDLLQAQEATNSQLVELVRLRYLNGQAQMDELLRQQRLTESSRTGVFQAEASEQALRQQLAALMGTTADAMPVLEGDAPPHLAPIMGMPVPSSWLRQRPDLRAAWLRVRSADADLAAAIASRYPRLDLSASLESAATRPSLMFEEWITSLAASLAVPIFDGGALRADIDRTEAAREVAFNNYAQTVVEAVAEVETALSNADFDRRQLESLGNQLTLAETVVGRLRQRYLNGAASYLDVLTALTTLQDIQRQHLEARWTLVLDRIELIRTLAGTWPETPRDQTNSGEGTLADDQEPS